MLATKLYSVSATTISVVSKGRARLELTGHVCGYIQVQSERRWLWGKFDESFLVMLVAGEAVDVRLWGLGGQVRKQIGVGARIDLDTPSVEVHVPSVTALVPSLVTPRIPRLRVRSMLPPRLLPLRRVASAVLPQESNDSL